MEIEKIEDAELKEIMNNFNEHVFPKFQILGDVVEKENDIFKVFGMTKIFLDDLTEEYNQKFGRNISEDLDKVNNYLLKNK